MYLIVGLGNPEDKYAKTRHNMGFDVVNELAKKYDISVNKKNFDGLFGTGIIEGKKVILLKPQTFMNLSGISVVDYLDYYKLDIEDLIIIYDDLDLDESVIRIRKFGGSGTHNGMKSIINSLQTEKFIRVRVGIGMSEDKNKIINHVIDKLSDEEFNKLKPGIEKATDAVIEIIRSGVDSAMNKYN